METEQRDACFIVSIKINNRKKLKKISAKKQNKKQYTQRSYKTKSHKTPSHNPFPKDDSKSVLLLFSLQLSAGRGKKQSPFPLP